MMHMQHALHVLDTPAYVISNICEGSKAS